MKKAKNALIKAISIMLSFVLTISVLPLHSFAVDNIDSEEQYTPDSKNYELESEVVSERSEYSKVYKLQDDTCYEIISPTPIHENVDGEWVEPDNNLMEPSSTLDVVDYCAELSQEILYNEENGGISMFGIDITDQNTPEVSYKVIASSGISNSRLTSSKLLVMKIPNVMSSASNKNQVTIDCRLYIDCQAPSAGSLYAHAINNTWDYDSSELEISDIEVDENIIDFCNLSTQSDIYSWDITDVYLKWEKGLKINNGIVLKSISSAKATISGCYITRQFKVLDSYDTDFTYHTFDMGRAGTVYVNDFTNTILLARNEIGFDSNILPVELQRYFDFGKAYATTNPSGEGARWNYDSKLSMLTSLTYLWETFDGSSIKFVPGNDIYNWIDSNNEGYVLTMDTQAINNGDFSNSTIVTPENVVYRFGAKGKVISITDQYSNIIEIVYKTNNQNNIDYIEDGLNRRYCFNYENVTYTNGNQSIKINTLVSIEAKALDENGNYSTIRIDEASAIINYVYVLLPNNHIALSKVVYPDNAVVQYEYEDGRLKSISDTDGRKLDISYTVETEEENESGEKNLKTIDYYPSAVSLTESVKNIDDKSLDDYLIKSKLIIDRHNNYQRKFTNHLNETEFIQYNQKLKILYYKSSDGETFYADYSDDEDGNDYLSQIVSPEDAVSCLDNYDFQSGRIEPWTECNGNSLHIEQRKNADDSTNCLLRVNGDANSMRYAVQNVDINGSLGDIYVVGALALANAPIPTPEHFFGIEVYKCVFDVFDEEYIVENEPIYRLAFDSTMDNESQFRLGAFKLDENVEALQFRLVYSFQAGEAYFDDAFLYESTVDNVSFFEPDDTTESSASTDDNETIKTYNDKGLVLTETSTDGTLSMLSQYQYSEDYFVSSITDNNNITTSYIYDSATGMLKQKGTNGSITEYKYTPVGALKEVTRVVQGLTDNVNEIKSKYSYSNDRIESIEHNGVKYTFNYNSFGNVKSVELESTPSPGAQKTELISYDYSNDYKQLLNKIEYANGNILTYNYDDAGNILKISSGKVDNIKLLYEYEYSTDNKLSKIIDHDSERVIEYLENGYFISALAENETGENLYSVTFDENGQKEINFFKSSYTIQNSESSYDEIAKETSYSSGCDFTIADINVHFRSNSVSDYFGRIKNSEISFNMSNNDDSTHIIRNTYTYKNYTNSVNSESVLATTNLIDAYKSEVITKAVDSNTGNETSNVLNTFTTSYEYDNAGRITHVYYAQGESDAILSAFYEYDSAGQLVSELDNIADVLTKYKYDSGGNITLKEIYQGEAFNFNDGTDTIIISEDAEPQTVVYGYDNSTNELISFSDLLTSYDGNIITYDQNGNPLKYYGGLSDNEYECNLTWEGALLKSVEKVNEDELYEYSYDDTGLRTKKTMFSLDENGTVIKKEREIDYIWDESMLVGYQMTTYENDVVDCLFTIKILYDEYDNPIGVYYHTEDLLVDESVDYGTQVFSDDNVFWFIKDGQGNIQALYSDIDDFTLGCDYDAFGDITIDMSGRFIDEVNEKLNNASSLEEKLFYSFLYTFALGACIDFSLSVGQNSYRGYLLDIETGLYYCQNRYYSPDWGRFISMDEPAQLTQNMEEPLNANLYAYCYNDPINNIDPSGRSSYSLTGVGLQAEMSACFLSFAGEVGIELIYVWSKNALYGYYYYGGGAGSGYTNRAINYFKSSLKDISMSPKVSLKNMANMFKLNWSITLGFFAVFTNKSFAWPNSYTGSCKSNSVSFGKWKGYKATGNGCKAYGICYAVAGNSGFAFSQSVAKYSKISFNSSAIKTYLSSQKNTIKNAVSS